MTLWSECYDNLPRRKKQYGLANVPADGDPVWDAWSQPLWAYIQTPRAWRTLTRWGRKNRIPLFRLRHTLAWLDNRKLARSYIKDGGVMWVGLPGGPPLEPE